MPRPDGVDDVDCVCDHPRLGFGGGAQPPAAAPSSDRPGSRSARAPATRAPLDRPSAAGRCRTEVRRVADLHDDDFRSDPYATSYGRIQGLMLRAILAYRRGFRGRPSPCRFFPTCSEYGYDAIAVHGAGRGGWLTARRLLRCRPFGPSGFDPVPEPRSSCSHHSPTMTTRSTTRSEAT